MTSATVVRRWISQTCERLGWSQVELAKRLGVAQRTIYNWLNGQEIGVYQAQRLEAADEILRWSNCREHATRAIENGYLRPYDLLEHLLACDQCRESWKVDVGWARKHFASESRLVALEDEEGDGS